MRLATLIISLILSLVLFVQACAVGVGGSLGEEFSEGKTEIGKAEELSGAGATGAFAGLLWVIAAGLVIAKPKASMWIYGVAAFLLVLVGTGGFEDGYIWAVVSMIFALMSWRGIRERRDKEERDRARYQADIAAAASAIQREGQG